MSELRSEDLIYLAYGSTFLGGGGGGTLASALEMIKVHFKGDPVRLLKVNEASETIFGFTAVCSFVGSQTAGQLVTGINAPRNAVRQLDRWVQKTHLNLDKRQDRILAL